MNEWRIDGFHEVRELGAGAQGRVVLARHATAGTPVAIKYLVRGAGAELERLRHEAVLLGRVRDPHVARLYRLVESEHGAAIVMEAVNGVPLKRVLSEHGALGAEASLTVLKGSLQGLAAAHAVGVVHRDYKPANVVVQADGLSKLIDFGIAVPQGADGRSGTPAYMPPEQWRGEPATPAADVYAATCVFYECVTGRRPFTGSGPELMAKHLNADVPVDELPEALREFVGRGMAKEPGERPAGAAAFVEELERAAAAAYGVDWEQRGVRALAGTAVALAALFPLVAAGIGSAAPVAVGTAAATGAAGAGTGVAGAAAGTGAAGSSAVGGGVAASSTGVFATVGGKAALVVAGTAVVAGTGGVVAYTAADDGVAAPPARPVAATVAVYNQTFTDARLVVQNAQYARITGLRDAAMQERVNKALREPLDWNLNYLRRSSTRAGAACTQDARLSTTTRMGLRGPSLVSAVYKTSARYCAPADGEMPGWAVTVDLKTGRALKADDVFKPGTLTASGLTALWGRLKSESDTGRRPWGQVMWGERGCVSGGPERKDFFPRQDEAGPWPATATAFFAPDQFEINWSSGGSTCMYDRLTAPYAKVRDLLKPEIVAMLPK
ncbi:serine/threonine-protein kinase [Spirillospora sp. NPDC029432]|uniref:serine/threonine-protein kinase n=1 Tax=Spirillospora sp. NPDC029432 TaxID=3154599 RepID=UPI003456E1C2